MNLQHIKELANEQRVVVSVETYMTPGEWCPDENQYEPAFYDDATTVDDLEREEVLRQHTANRAKRMSSWCPVPDTDQVGFYDDLPF